ncbi:MULTISPECIES: biotin-dependent carboxyltransferase family protein [unclassified Paracoccus (in: a-proteobacteria)]|uniref:5-oxoprolinase subunit C family protein n=1 Tax=unclassified Paracoccus (in: a-proteobacteria) TaxID=2688777 RepID=UPI0016010FAC|nr:MULTISPECIES: biotin-dependent carboxyltransferase family protein [unclassified Paracoccus (in: a-proteobacteria)]MBB1491290.1 biotin-dependent carboxyltransferase family protein [Paracoccus sp. MC1854]MBB1498068.1 biotin-dependent carboxyltransferase family protein [Paracoccus sp. MC1862]QQO43494.1 biotin-dependent carboxyltransferase family protein [Paracoccus sp. MC1862]
MSLLVLSSNPGVTIQDRGRPGWLAQGLSRGGAADPVALAEGAALLGQPDNLAVVELAGAPARFRVTAPARLALTGAPFRAILRDGEERPLDWNAIHLLPAGSELALYPIEGGFAYLALGGGIETPLILGARSAHLAAEIGGPLSVGGELPLGPDSGEAADLALDPLPRFGGGEIRVVESLQTALYPPAEIARFQRSTFRRDARGNRMGVRLTPEGGGFELAGGLSVVSEIVQPGDIQITGDGTPFVLLSECQTTGGYPRIATVLPCDLPRVAQAPPGAALTIRFVTRNEARKAMADHAQALASLRGRVRPRLRDPWAVPDLLGYNLIGGVVSAHEGDGP